MPSIKNFEKKKQGLKKASKVKISAQELRLKMKRKHTVKTSSPRQRPWEKSDSVDTVLAQEITDESVKLNPLDSEKVVGATEFVDTKASAEETIPKEESIEPEEIKIWSFYGDQWLKENNPTAYDLTQKFLQDWTAEVPTFTAIQTPYPIMTWALSKGLQRAKKIESKLEEKGVLSLVKMGAYVVKSEIEKRKAK